MQVIINNKIGSFWL